MKKKYALSTYQRTGMLLKKYVLLASSTYFYHKSCSQYMMHSTNFNAKYMPGTYKGQNVRTAGGNVFIWNPGIY